MDTKMADKKEVQWRTRKRAILISFIISWILVIIIIFKNTDTQTHLTALQGLLIYNGSIIGIYAGAKSVSDYKQKKIDNNNNSNYEK